MMSLEESFEFTKRRMPVDSRKSEIECVGIMPPHSFLSGPGKEICRNGYMGKVEESKSSQNDLNHRSLLSFENYWF